MDISKIKYYAKIIKNKYKKAFMAFLIEDAAQQGVEIQSEQDLQAYVNLEREQANRVYVDARSKGSELYQLKNCPCEILL